MARQVRNKPTVDPIITYVWIKAQFDGLNTKLNLILAEIKKIQPNPNVAPELETAINRNTTLARSVDRKVPDL